MTNLCEFGMYGRCILSFWEGCLSDGYDQYPRAETVDCLPVDYEGLQQSDRLWLSSLTLGVSTCTA
jgi:hypothetical protein